MKLPEKLGPVPTSLAMVVVVVVGVPLLYMQLVLVPMLGKLQEVKPVNLVLEQQTVGPTGASGAAVLVASPSAKVKKGE